MFNSLPQGCLTFFHDAWNTFSLVMHSLYAVSYAVWAAGVIYARTYEFEEWQRNHTDATIESYINATTPWGRHQLGSYNPVLIAEAFFCIATMMAFITILKVVFFFFTFSYYVVGKKVDVSL